jgi:hypothetical protein
MLGALMLVHRLTGLTTPYIILQSMQTPTGFAANEPGSSFRVRLAVMFLFVSGALILAMTTIAWPVVRQYSYALAFWLAALAVANLSLQCIENAGYLTMFTFSQDFFVSASAPDVGIYHVAGAAIRTAWKWAHYTHLLVMGSWILLLFVTLWRGMLVPRILAALGVLGSLLQMTGITLPQFLAYRSPAPLAMGLSLAVMYFATSVWLMVKGIPEPAKRS